MGMSHIPEDRHKHGLVLDYSIEQNMVLQRYWQPEFESFGFIKSKAVREYAERLIEQYDVRSGQGPVTITRSMSGETSRKRSSRVRSTKILIFSLRYSLPWS